MNTGRATNDQSGESDRDSEMMRAITTTPQNVTMWKRRLWGSLTCSCLAIVTGCVGPGFYDSDIRSESARSRMVHRAPIYPQLNQRVDHSTRKPALERRSSVSRPRIQQTNYEIPSSIEASPELPALAAERVRCQAALASTPVQLIEIERQFAFEKTSNTRCISEEVANQVQQLLMLRSAIRGNEASVAALQLYYQLAEGHAQLGYLQESLQNIEMMQSDVARILARGFAVEIRQGDLERQKLEIEQKQQEIEGQLAQGWARLQPLLGEEPTAPMPDFMTLEERPTSAPTRETAVQTAMHLRPELRLLRVLIHGIRAETLSAAIAALQQAEASLGTASELDILKQLSDTIFVIKPFTKFCRTRDVEVRTTQLVVLLNGQEQAVRGEIHAAIAAWNAATERWHIADRLVSSWDRQLDELRQKQAVDETITSFDIRQAELERIQAKSDRLAAFFATKQAEVSLLKAQGTAAIGCGLAGHEPFWCESCKMTHGGPIHPEPHQPTAVPGGSPSYEVAPQPLPAPEPPAPLTGPSVRSPRLIQQAANTAPRTLTFQPTRSLGKCRPISRPK